MPDTNTTAPSRISTVDGGSFQAVVLEATGRVAVEFMSYGCGYCRAIEPFLEDAAWTVWPDEMIFRVDVTADPELASAWRIGGTPTFVMFLNGAEVARSEGPSPDLASVLAVVSGPFVA